MKSFLHQLFPQIKAFKKNGINAQNDEIMGSSSIWTLILIFCCLVITTTISYRATKGLIEDNMWVLHTQEVIEQVLEISVKFRTAESRQRGYILTGEEEYLEHYHDALREVDTHLATLRKLVVDNPDRLIQVQHLAQLIERRTTIMQSVLNAYKNEGLEKGRETLQHSGGLSVMNEFANLTDAIETDEKRLLNERSISSLDSRNYALRGLVIGGIFSLALVLFSYYLLVNDFRRRRQVAQELASARDNLEVKVAERTQELEQINRELQEFAYIASHDLQEPLRKIQVFGDRLKHKANDQLDATALDYLERMQNAAKRMHTLINDLLLFSRVSANGNTVELTLIDLNQVVQEVLSDLEGSIDHYGGHVCLDTLPTIKGNPLQMRQLLQNILSNALKFHRIDAPPEISIVWQNQAGFSSNQATEKFYEIAITDNGIGIDPQFVDKIFIPFQRLHGKNEYEGTGIGLAVCRKIIERHHGYIKVSPAPTGQGTMFKLGFPIT
jgi:signal transduction histidine kinase